MKRVVDYKAVQLRRRVHNSRPVRIPRSRRLVLGTIRLTIPRNERCNNVELHATVGVRGITGIAQLIFRVTRGGRDIFTAQQGIESTGSEQNYIVSFQAIDHNVRPGKHEYRVTVENRTRNTRAVVVGPVNFSGLVTVKDRREENREEREEIQEERREEADFL